MVWMVALAGVVRDLPGSGPWEGIMFVPDFSEHVVIREFAGRFGEAMHRSQPFYFYLPHLLHRFAPWSILLILLPLLGAREQGSKIRDSLRAMSPETFWLVAWSLGGLLVMSFVPSKRIDRVFPIVPPLCLLLAASGRRVSSERKVEGANREVLHDSASHSRACSRRVTRLGKSFWDIARAAMRLPLSERRSGRKRLPTD